eukprot:365973-Chlamydomonas_euryale.AAC.3
MDVMCHPQLFSVLDTGLAWLDAFTMIAILHGRTPTFIVPRKASVAGTVTVKPSDTGVRGTGWTGARFPRV